MSDNPEEAAPRKRLLVIVGVVVVLVLVAAGVFAVTRSTDDGTSASNDSSTLVRYDPEQEVLEVLDLAGDVQRTIEVPGTSDAAYVPQLAGRVVFDASGDGSVTVVSMEDGSVDTYDLPVGEDSGLSLNRFVTAADERLLFDDVNGGDVLSLDLDSGEFTSVVELVGGDDGRPELIGSRRIPDGWIYFDASAEQPRTIIVPFASAADPWSVSGAVADLDGERTLIAPMAESASAISILDRERLVAEAEIDANVRGGMLTGDDTALVVGDDGQLYAMSGGEVDELDRLDIDVQYVRALGNDRLFVLGDDGQQSFIMDGAGDIVVEFDPVDGRAMRVTQVSLQEDGRCVLVQPGVERFLDAGDVLVVDVVSGETLAEFRSSAVLLDTADTCSAVSDVDDVADVVLDGELRKFDDFVAVSAVSFDLEHVVLRTRERGENAIVEVDSGDKVEIGEGFYAFVPG